MKKNNSLSILVIICAMLSLAASCKKNNDGTPNGTLPPATQTGANTFGCMVDGKIFLPESKQFSGQSAIQANYIYTNGGYNLTVVASNSSYSNHALSVILGTNLLPVSEGQTLKLENRENGKASGLYNFITGSVIMYQTTTIVNGQLHLSKFDQTNQIISGTFSFNAVNSTKSDTIHVTDGRFDMQYTQ